MTGEETFSMKLNNLNLSKKNKTRVPMMNKGTASLRYHSILAQVFRRRLEILGTLIGGISKIKSELLPGITSEAKNPTRTMTRRTTPDQIKVAVKDNRPNIPKITPNWAEQGTPKAKSRVTIIFSFLLPKILEVKVAMVSHPKPKIIGRTAFPFRPMNLKRRLPITAKRSRYA